MTANGARPGPRATLFERVAMRLLAKLLVITPTINSCRIACLCSQRSWSVALKASGTFFSTTCSSASGCSAGWTSQPGWPGQNTEPGVREMCRTCPCLSGSQPISPQAGLDSVLFEILSICHYTAPSNFSKDALDAFAP